MSFEKQSRREKIFSVDIIFLGALVAILAVLLWMCGQATVGPVGILPPWLFRGSVEDYQTLPNIWAPRQSLWQLSNCTSCLSKRHYSLVAPTTSIAYFSTFYSLNWRGWERWRSKGTYCHLNVFHTTIHTTPPECLVLNGVRYVQLYTVRQQDLLSLMAIWSKFTVTLFHSFSAQYSLCPFVHLFILTCSN